MIDDILQKLGIEPNKYYKLTVLWKVLYEIGITRQTRRSFTSDWWIRNMQAGKIIMPELRPGEKWRITGKQIRAIAFAFVPGGSGHYDYREEV